MGLSYSKFILDREQQFIYQNVEKRTELLNEKHTSKVSEMQHRTDFDVACHN